MYKQILHKKERDFSPYVEFVGNSFAQSLGEQWRKFGVSKVSATENTYWNHVSQFLRFLCEQDAFATLRDVLKSKKKLPIGQETALWQNALTLYRTHLKECATPRTANNKTTGVRAFFCDYLANRGIVPHSLQLEGFSFELGIGRGTTLLSPKTLSSLGMSSEQFKKFCLQVAQREDDDALMDSDIAELLAEAFEQAQGNASDIDRVALAIKVIDSRINAISATAVKRYFQFMQDTKEANDWLNDVRISGHADQLWQLVNSSTATNKKGRKYQNALQLNPLAVFVVMLQKHNGGRYPKETDSWYSKFTSLKKRQGITSDDIKRRLGFDIFAMTCAYTFIILEAYANSESIRNLKVDDLENGAFDCQYVLRWQKPRAGAWSAMSRSFARRPSSSPFSPDTLTVEDVFSHQLECRKPFEGLIRKEDKKKLFIAWYKNNSYSELREMEHRPATPTVSSFNRHFKSLCEEASDGAWEATPKSLRGTKLLLRGLLSRDLLDVQTEGQHQSLVSSWKYIHYVPEYLRREKNIRDFLEWMEALVTVDIEGFAQKIGIEEDAYAKRLSVAKDERVKQSGDENERAHKLAVKYNQQFGGLHCINPYEGVQPGTRAGEICNKVQNCPTCKNRRGIFVLTLDNLVNILQWNAVLNDAYALELKEWRIWSVFTRTLLQSIKDNPTHKTLFDRASELALSQQNPYKKVIPIKVMV